LTRIKLVGAAVALASEAEREISLLADADAATDKEAALAEARESEAVAVALLLEESDTEESVAEALKAERDALAVRVLVSMEESTELELADTKPVLSAMLAVMTLEAEIFDAAFAMHACGIAVGMR